MPVVLVAEDEPPLVEVLTYNLSKAGFETVTATNGTDALEQAATLHPDVMILDWMMPGKSGIEVCKGVREHAEVSDLPILMLTARGDEADRVQGLEAGADDYMVKPFSPRELVARVNALLRRSSPASADVTLHFGDIQLNVEQHKVSIHGQPIKLGPTEYRLLKYLMENPGRVHSRESLLNRVWTNGVYVESRTVDVHIRRLRKALQDVGGINPVRTVRGAGYALDWATQ